MDCLFFVSLEGAFFADILETSEMHATRIRSPIWRSLLLLGLYNETYDSKGDIKSSLMQGEKHFHGTNYLPFVTTIRLIIQLSSKKWSVSNYFDILSVVQLIHLHFNYSKIGETDGTLRKLERALELDRKQTVSRS